MKGKFTANADYLRTDETLKAHKPYLVLAVSSTGINNKDFGEHRPIKVCLQEYVYDDTIKGYAEGMQFEKLIKCSEEALQYALAHADTYDVFKNDNIDKAAYQRGENVLSVEDFKKEFTDFMHGISEDEVIIANNASFCISMLKSIDCDEPLVQAKENRRLLDQPKITRAFLYDKTGNQANYGSLVELRNYIRNTPDNAQQIIGLKSRIAVMNEFMQFRGRELNYLASENEYDFLRETRASFQTVSESAKQEYKNAEFEGKLKSLVDMGIVSDKNLDRSYDCSLNRLYDVIEGRNGIRGAVIMQVATTGKDKRDLSTDPPKLLSAGNKPIQFTAVLCELENGKLTVKNFISIEIKAPDRNIQAMLQIKNLPDPKNAFDAFKYAGINEEAYRSGKCTDKATGAKTDKPLKTEEQAVLSINKFFSGIDLEKYPIITNGTDDKSRKSFTQAALMGMGYIKCVDAPFIDFTQALKEYCYVAHKDENYPQNALIDENTWSGKKFSLEDFAAARGNPDIRHTQDRCGTVLNLFNVIAQQHLEINKELGIELPQQALTSEVEQGTLQTPQQGERQAHDPEVSARPAAEREPQTSNPVLGTSEQETLKPTKPFLALKIGDYVRDRDGEIFRVKSRSGTFSITLEATNPNAEEKTRSIMNGWLRKAEQQGYTVVSDEEAKQYEAKRQQSISAETQSAAEPAHQNNLVGNNDRETGSYSARHTFSRQEPPSRFTRYSSDNTPTFGDKDYEGEDDGIYKTEEQFIEGERYSNIRDAVNEMTQHGTDRPEKREIAAERPFIKQSHSSDTYNTQYYRTVQGSPKSERQAAQNPKQQASRNANKPLAAADDTRKTIVINAFGSNEAEKNKACMYVAAELMRRGYSTEYVPDYTKELVYDNVTGLLDGSLNSHKQILEEQVRRIDRLNGKVDFIITADPILLNGTNLANTPEKADFEANVAERFNSHDNFCFFVNDNTEKDKAIAYTLHVHRQQYEEYNEKQVEKVTDNILRSFGRINPSRSEEIEAEIQRHSLNISSGQPKEMPQSAQDIKQGNGLSPDVLAIVTAMNQNTAAVIEQNSILRNKNDILEQTFAAQNRVLTTTIAAIADISKEQELSKSTVERLEDLKDQIIGITDTISNKKAQDSLLAANGYISRGQLALDRLDSPEQVKAKNTKD